MTLKDLRKAAEARGMTEDQIEKLLFPYKISAYIEEQKEAGLSRKEILSNVHYVTEQTFDFGVAVRFSAFVEDYMKSGKNELFIDAFRRRAKEFTENKSE